MREHIYEYLYLTRQERNGLLVIISMSAMIAFSPIIYTFFSEETKTDFSNFKKEIKSFFEAEEIAPPIAFANTGFSKSKNKKSKVEHFPFDPNVSSKDEFIRLGLSAKTAQTILNFRNKGAKFYKKEDFKKVYGLKNSDYERLKDFIQVKNDDTKIPKTASNSIPKSYDSPQVNYTSFDPNTADVNVLLQNGIPKHVANTIINFRNKGGQFRTKEDLKKIYSLKDEIYNRIEPYVNISPTEKKSTEKTFAEKEEDPKKKFERENITIDINASQPEDWQKLYGIGPSFSRRICNYRDKLGGFYSIEQVSETYGLPDSTFQKIKSQLKPSPVFKKINLNQATEDHLKKHPYINWKQAKLIISYRRMHGEFKDVNELLQIRAFKKEWVEKVKHYLAL